MYWTFWGLKQFANLKGRDGMKKKKKKNAEQKNINQITLNVTQHYLYIELAFRKSD